LLLLGGVSFVVEPKDRITARERATLSKLPRVTQALASAPFRVRLVEEPPWREDGGIEPGPARVSWEAGCVRLRHTGFLSELDLFGNEARLFRRGDGYGLEATLRAAMSGRLPLLGGLPLHAAALVIESRGLVFFGPSGAGKSTISSLWGGPVLSDELVAVTRAETSGLPGEGYAVAITGFWGTMGRAKSAPESAPLGALIELAKGPAFRFERLSVTEALRRLVGVTMVPDGPPLWSQALGAIGMLVRTVPCYRMAWSPEEPPFERLVLVEKLGFRNPP
jgi:hypothetical protein